MKIIARLGMAGMIGLGWTVAATGQSISSTREIRYPTEWRHQESGNMVDTAYRVPVPSAFETRVTGVRSRVGHVGVARTITIDMGRPAHHVRFNDGREAILADGRETVVDGVRYRGLGRRADGYYAMDMRTRRAVSFRYVPASDAARGDR